MAPFDNFQHSSPFFNAEAMKYFKNFKIPAMDTEPCMLMQRKNMDAIVRSQQTLFEAVAAISAAQAQFVQASLELLSQFTKTMQFNPDKPQEQITANTKAAEEAPDRFIKHGQELAQIWISSNEKIMQTHSSRMDECMKEAQTIAKKATRT